MANQAPRFRTPWISFALPLLVPFLCWAESPLRAKPYLARLAGQASSWRQHLQGMDDSAHRAAEGTIAGGAIYAYGPQPGFGLEVVSRAGGLMLAQLYSSDVKLTSRDTILAAVTGLEDETAKQSLRHVVDEAAAAEAQVVLFGINTLTPTSSTVVGQPCDRRAFSDDPSLASVSNVLGMWAWTGRYIAACVTRGSMPCVFQSHILPHGRERTQYLMDRNGGRFHNVSSVRPEDADWIAVQYLTEVENSLRRVLADEHTSLKRAAELLRESRDRGNIVAIHSLGHMFPGEFQQPLQPDWLMPTDALPTDAAVDTSLVLHYMSFPWVVVDRIANAGQSCVVTCSQPALADFTASPSNVYVNPHWSIYDSVVELPNYDVRMLPASGVLTAAVYWQLVEWATKEQE